MCELLHTSLVVQKSAISNRAPASAQSMRDSAQVIAPGAIANMIAAVSTRPNRQNRSTCSRMLVQKHGPLALSSCKQWPASAVAAAQPMTVYTENSVRIDHVTESPNVSSASVIYRTSSMPVRPQAAVTAVTVTLRIAHYFLDGRFARHSLDGLPLCWVWCSQPRSYW